MAGELECDDCEATEDLAITIADLGEGAFLAVLCPVCWHRREYRGDLQRRLDKRRTIIVIP